MCNRRKWSSLQRTFKDRWRDKNSSFFGQPSITAALPLTKKSYTQLHQLRATFFSFYKDTAYKDVGLGNGQYLRTWYFNCSYLYCFPRLRFSVAKSNSIRGCVRLSVHPSVHPSVHQSISPSISLSVRP